MVMQRAITIQEFLELPETKPGLEFLHGRVSQKPVTNADHIKIVWRLSAAFHAFAATLGGRGGPEGSVAIDSGGPEPDVLLPDFTFWAEGIEMGTYPLNPPTIAVEVRSPSQTLASQRTKCEFYVRNGVTEAWLFDPESTRVELFGSDGSRETFGRLDTLRSNAISGLDVKLTAIFD